MHPLAPVPDVGLPMAPCLVRAVHRSWRPGRCAAVRDSLWGQLEAPHPAAKTNTPNMIEHTIRISR